MSKGSPVTRIMFILGDQSAIEERTKNKGEDEVNLLDSSSPGRAPLHLRECGQSDEVSLLNIKTTKKSI